MTHSRNYKEVKKRVELEQKLLDKYFKETKRNWINEKIRKERKIPKVTNAERSFIEVENFKRGKGQKKYVAYMKNDLSKITTWTGDKLADVTKVGQPFRDSFGGERINFRAKGIDGKNYSGTYFKSAGDYVRIKKVKK